MFIKKHLIKSITAFLLLMSGTVSAGEKINKRLEVTANGEVEIHNVRGDIQVKGWDKNEVMVKGELDDLAEQFIFETKNGRTLIKVVLPSRNSNARSGSGSELEVFMPNSQSLQFGGVSTDVVVSDLNNGIDISSVSGDIKLNAINGKAYINSVSGNIDVNGVSGRLNISTVSGDVDAKLTSENIEVSGVSSDIKVSTSQIDSVKIGTVSGDTSLRGILKESGSIKLSNVSGKSLYFSKPEINARVVLDTGPGGEITNDLTEHKPARSFIGSEKLKFSIGDGSAQIRMSTVSGEIGIRNEN